MPQLSPKIRDALNQQINVELSSAYRYLAMSAYCSEANLQGAATWLRLQWQEELAHATKLIDYMGDRGGGVSLKAVPQPPGAFQSLPDVFEKVLHDEQEVTAAIYRIYDLAMQEKDYAAQGLMQWYVQEQVEEENSAAEIVSMLRMAGDSAAGLLIVDRRLAERTAAG
ncbi:MAG: ferritin [Dehalococcoidia bacterium]|nr:ferritin [Dehalococcoidia bacterium]